VSARTTAPSQVASAAQSGGRTARRFLRVRELGIVFALVLLVGVTAATNPRFLSPQSIRDLLLSAVILVTLAVGQTILIVTRNIDLSVGSIVGLVAFGTGKLLLAAPGTPLLLVIAAALAGGAVCGAINGGLVAAARVPALVVTLGTLYIFRGVDFIWASGQQINAADMPRAFLRLGTMTVLGSPVPVLALFALAVVLAAGWYLGSYRSGRELYAMGSDPDAARLSGIPVGRRVFAAFVANGAIAGLAGMLYAARFGTLDAVVGTGLELQVVAAAVVGGVAIFGGSGTVYGAAVGALLLQTMTTALVVLRINAFWQQAVVGALILAAISLDRVLVSRLGRQLRGRSTRGA
jgi:rhamnose transport system permease protein